MSAAVVARRLGGHRPLAARPRRAPAGPCPGSPRSRSRTSSPRPRHYAREEARRAPRPSPRTASIAATLGIVTPAKRIGKLLEALALLPATAATAPRRRRSRRRRRPAPRRASATSASRRTSGFTGYLSDDDFWRAGASRGRRGQPAVPDGGRDVGGGLPSRRVRAFRSSSATSAGSASSRRASRRRSRSATGRSRRSRRALGSLAADDGIPACARGGGACLGRGAEPRADRRGLRARHPDRDRRKGGVPGAPRAGGARTRRPLESVAAACWAPVSEVPTASSSRSSGCAGAACCPPPLTPFVEGPER